MVRFSISSDEDRISELLRRLENPLSFIGETRPTHVDLDGTRTSVSDILQKASVDPRSRDEFLSLLNRRLLEIKGSMKKMGISIEEANTLYREGIAVKHTIYVLKKRPSPDEDPHADMRRWMDFGKRMRKG